jgi:hypothetical protein
MANARPSSKPAPKAATTGSRRSQRPAPASAAPAGNGQKSKTASLAQRKAGGESREDNGKRRKLPRIAGDLSARGVATVASRVVEQAASILEEEVARGIVAAKQIEERYVDVAALRATDPDHVMQRFRKDAHELVDILIDLVHVTVRSVGRAVTVEASAKGALPAAGGGSGREITTIEMPGPVAAGKSTELQFMLTNSDETPTPPFTFRTLGLVNANGDEISAEHVVLSPKRVSIPPHGSAPLKVEVNTPEGISPGLYTGLLQSTHLDKLCATLSVQVV